MSVKSITAILRVRKIRFFNLEVVLSLIREIPKTIPVPLQQDLNSTDQDP